VTSALSYSVEYVTPNCPPVCPTVAVPGGVSVTASQAMTSLASVSAFPGFSGFFPDVQAALNIGAFNAALILDEGACLNGCISGGPPATPFASGISTQSIPMLENTAYLVQMQVWAQGLGFATADVDPTFSTTSSDGSFIFSPGIQSAGSAPETSSWLMALTGFGLLAGFRMYRKARRSA
jgi:hypothetical protein